MSFAPFHTFLLATIRQGIIITARKRSLPRLCIYTCLSVILLGGSTWAGTPPGQVHLRQVHPLAGTPPRSSACWEIRATRGRYASYWKAFLLQGAFCIPQFPFACERPNDNLALYKSFKLPFGHSHSKI